MLKLITICSDRLTLKHSWAIGTNRNKAIYGIRRITINTQVEYKKKSSIKESFIVTFNITHILLYKQLFTVSHFNFLFPYSCIFILA